MAASITKQIKSCIETIIDSGGENNIIIFPYGDIGMEAVYLMERLYDIKPKMIIDNHLCKYNKKILPLNCLGGGVNCSEYRVLLATANPDLYLELKNEARRYVDEEQIFSLSSVMLDSRTYLKSKTIIGRHSGGPIVRNHALIESIGNFCSIAMGVDVVPNHPTSLISTHAFLYTPMLKIMNERNLEETYKDESWYISGIRENGYTRPRERVKIGSDVWIGRNVIITNGACIGNGAIIGAGAIVTHDIPDYAVAVGVPARIIKYRYTKEQIAALNEIKWWDWTDEQISNRYNDFFLDVEDFIKKYL